MIKKDTRGPPDQVPDRRAFDILLFRSEYEVDQTLLMNLA